MPKYQEVSEWVKDWAGEKNAEFFRNAFVLTGLVPVREFDINKLHTPLKLCYDEATTEEDLMNNGFIMTGDVDTDSEAVSWDFFPGQGSFYRALHAIFDAKSEPSIFVRNVSQRLLVTINSNVYLKTILDDEDKKAILDGKPTETGIEIVAATILYNCYFKIITIDSIGKALSEDFYGEESGGNKVVIARFEDMFGVDSENPDEM
jgi:hypothetical protein